MLVGEEELVDQVEIDHEQPASSLVQEMLPLGQLDFCLRIMERTVMALELLQPNSTLFPSIN